MLKPHIFILLGLVFGFRDVNAELLMADDKGNITKKGSEFAINAHKNFLDKNVVIAESNEKVAKSEYVLAMSKAFIKTKINLLDATGKKTNENPAISTEVMTVQLSVQELLEIVINGDLDKNKFFAYVHKHCGEGKTPRDNERLTRLTARLLANTRKLTRVKDVGYAWGVLTYQMNKTPCTENPIEVIRVVDNQVYREYFALKNLAN